jgi:DGQHR domain-containing protein
MSNHIKENTLILTNFVEVSQNLSKFIICSIKASDLLKISKPFPRDYNEDSNAFIGIQRKIDDQKINELKKYINTDDACFPNSIITNLDTSFLEEYTDTEIKIKIKDDDNPESRAIFIIDGQHRVESFRNQDNAGDFELIVSIFLGISIEEQAFLFSTINNKQKRLNSSLVQDLNDLFTIETPEKIVHVLTKLFNSQEDSPWKDKIKILGKNIKKSDGTKTDGIMSQYSFAKEIIKLIYGGGKSYFTLRNILKDKNKRSFLENENIFNLFLKKYIFWSYYVKDDEKYIYQTLLSYFIAIKNKFDGWGDKKFILTKTTGYIAFMKFYKDIFIKEIDKSKLVNIEYFEQIFQKIKDSQKIKELKSINYPSGIKGQNELYKDLIEGSK